VLALYEKNFGRQMKELRELVAELRELLSKKTC
jgi:hypothetical protein